MSPPPSPEDTIPQDDTPGAAPTGGTQGHGFSLEFASVGEFLSFARTEMAGSDASLSLVENNLSARELDLASWEETVLAQEKLQAVEDVMLIVQEARVAEQERDLTRLSDLEDSERVHLATIEALQDRIALDADRLEQGLESMDN